MDRESIINKHYDPLVQKTLVEIKLSKLNYELVSQNKLSYELVGQNKALKLSYELVDIKGVVISYS